MRIKFKILFFVLVSCLASLNLAGQVTRIRGVVVDKETKEPLPFVNVAIEGTTVGTTTGFEGEFFLETRQVATKLNVTYMGYFTYTTAIKQGAYQSVNIALAPESIALNEIVVIPGENPAHPVLRNIIANKKQNDPTRIERFQYEVYNKMELDINNITEEYKQQKAFNQFQFIFDYVDTSAITGKTFLPVFITETLSDFYFQRRPHKRKEVIKASNISGVDSDQISDFTGQMYLDFNFYDNHVPIMGKEMVSPIANFGLMYYKYYLIDSAFRDDHWCYHVSFQPKRKQEPTFTGYFWVQDTTYAIESYKIRLAEGVNINFVTDFVAEQKYIQVDDSIWFPQKQELFVDFEISNKEYGFFGRKTTEYTNIELNPELDGDFFSAQLSQETVTLDSAHQFSAEDWDIMRPSTLTQRESDIYHMVDSIQEVPLYNSVMDLITMFITGYWVKGPIEIGPYYTLYSFNPLEGNRFKIGLRTSNDFSTKWMLYGHLAYGTRDAKLKYGIGTKYMFNNNPRRTADIHYFRDYELLGVSNNAFQNDNILGSIFSREQNDKLTTVNEIEISYEHEWFAGFSNTLSARNRIVYASETVPFLRLDDNLDTIAYDNVVTTEITLKSRFAFNEKFIYGNFERMSLGTKYPVLHMGITTGIQGLFDSDFEYYKLNVGIEHRFPIHPFGDFEYLIYLGRVYGDVPFPFMQIHEGNQTYAYDKYAFNLMNYYEFVSTRYVALMVSHHFNGMFLNHVPLFRKLKWREVIGAKALGGDIAQREDDRLLFPNTLTNLDKDPYLEASVGIENMFKFFRIDAVWRLTYLDNPNITTFGILAKMQVRF